MDPVGNVPIFAPLLKDYPPERQRRIVLREHLAALALLVGLLFGGRYLLLLLRIEGPALYMAGGIVLFLIALRMIFSDPQEIFGRNPAGEPFIVPLAVPLIAGPSTISTVLLVTWQTPERWPTVLLALVCAWLASLLILLGASFLGRLLGAKVLVAFERLMGMLLTAIAVQTFLHGLKDFIRQG
jgi:MarC family membrane protein